MKYIVLLGDGMADLPDEKLNGKTPLEIAYKPNIDGLAKRGVCGMVKTIPDGMNPGSDVANLSVLGYDPLKYYSGRSPLEALSIGIEMREDDLAVRCNLVTLSNEDNYESKTMLDYSAGEISTDEASILIRAVQAELGDDKFKFYSGVSYRHCLIAKSSDRGTKYTPPHDILDKNILSYLPAGKYGERMIDLMRRSVEVLEKHPINIKRIEKGLNPASSIWLWGEGVKPKLPLFFDLYQKKAVMISAVDLLKGIAIAGGMRVVEVDGATGTLETNFLGKAKACVEQIKGGCDYVYLHMEAPDECGHQGDYNGKIKAIEMIDDIVCGYILKELAGEDVRVLIAPDHPTPLATRTHTSDSVPFIIYDSTSDHNGVEKYTEAECAKSGIVVSSGVKLVEMFFEKEEHHGE